ncbi:MAG TPA: hypothetical protein VJA21_21295 [Verrucomicrobiae bacterium]
MNCAVSRGAWAAVKGGAVVALAIGLMFQWSAFAGDARPAGVEEELSRVAAAEMPAKAAEIVRSAKPRERGRLTVRVVKSAVAINPASAGTVVSAVSKAMPEMASVAAGAAAEAQPKEAIHYARVAASAAPAQAEKIVAAVCRAVPGQYKSVALAVASAVPAASLEVLRGVAAAVPGVRPGIEAALADRRDKAPSVPVVLESVKPLPAPAILAPTVAGTPLGLSTRGSEPPSVLPPGSDPPPPGPGPRGQRNYAAP